MRQIVIAHRRLSEICFVYRKGKLRSTSTFLRKSSPLRANLRKLVAQRSHPYDHRAPVGPPPKTLSLGEARLSDRSVSTSRTLRQSGTSATLSHIFVCGTGLPVYFQLLSACTFLRTDWNRSERFGAKLMHEQIAPHVIARKECLGC